MSFLKNYSWVKLLLDGFFFYVSFLLSYYILTLIFWEWELFGGGGLWLIQAPGYIINALLGYLISFRLSFIKNLKLKITSFFETNKYTSKFVAYVQKPENLWILGVILIVVGILVTNYDEYCKTIGC